jgi:hypothetical protein
MKSKRDHRLLLVLVLFLVSVAILMFDFMDQIEYLTALYGGDDSYFEKRFEVKKPTGQCFDCWPPWRTGWALFWMSGFALTSAGLVYCWWKPKP